MNLNDLFTEEKVRLDPKCWTGKKIGNPKTKIKGGTRVNNCVPAESVNEMDKSQTPPGRDGSNDEGGKKEYTAKATTPEKVAKHGEKILNKELNKKKGVAGLDEAHHGSLLNPKKGQFASVIFQSQWDTDPQIDYYNNLDDAKFDTENASAHHGSVYAWNGARWVRKMSATERTGGGGGYGSWEENKQGVAEGPQEDAKFTPRLQIRSQIETALDQYLDPEKVAGAYTDIQYYKHDGKVYVEVLFNYTDGQKIGPKQRKQFLVNKDFTLTPIKKQGVAEGANNHRALGRHHEEMADQELRKVGSKLPDSWDAVKLRNKLASHPKYAQALKHLDKSEYHFGKAAKQGVAEGQVNEKSVSQAQFRTMAAAAHNPKFAKKVGISQDVAREFNKADKGQDYKKLPARTTEESERGRGRPTTGEWDPTSGKVGRTEKTPTGIRHHADPSRYGGTEPDSEFDTLNKNTINAMDRALGVKWDRESKKYFSPLKVDMDEGEQQKGADYRDPPEADYGDDYQDMVARVKKLAGLGPLKTVYDPERRVYRNVPVAVQPKR
jgi:hypothetical protein